MSQRWFVLFDVDASLNLLTEARCKGLTDLYHEASTMDLKDVLPRKYSRFLQVLVIRSAGIGHVLYGNEGK